MLSAAAPTPANLAPDVEDELLTGSEELTLEQLVMLARWPLERYEDWTSSEAQLAQGNDWITPSKAKP